MNIGAASRPDRRPRRALRLGWAAVVILVVYAILLGGTYVGIGVASFRALSLVLIVAVLATWAILAFLQPEWRPRTAIWPAIVLPLAVFTLATAASPYPRLGVEYVLWWVLLVALYLFSVRLFTYRLARSGIADLALVLGLVLGLVYLGHVAALWFEWWQLLGRLTLPMLRPAYAGLVQGGPTVVAQLAILMLGIALGGFDLRGRRRQIALAALLGVTPAVVFLTGSRASWLGLAAAVMVTGVGVVLQNRDLVRAALGHRPIKVALALSAMAALGIVGALGPSLLERVTSAGDGGRAQYIATALRMFEASPLLGQGGGNWAVQRLGYTEPGELDYYVSHAHNMYAQSLAETGIVGVVAGIMVVAVVLRLLIKGVRSDDSRQRRWAWAALFVLVYVGVLSLADSLVNMPVAIMLAAIPIAVVDAARCPPLGPRASMFGTVTKARLGLAFTVLLFAAAAAAAAALFRVESIAVSHGRAVSLVVAGDWDGAAIYADRAVAADPGMPAYHMTRGLAAAGRGEWHLAETSFAAAAEVDDSPHLWMNLALARQEMGRPAAEVRASIDAALRVGDQHPSVLLAAGYLLDRLGMEADADAAFIEVLLARPILAADPAWNGELTTADRMGKLLDAAIRRSPVPWELALWAGQPDRARRLAQQAGSQAWISAAIDAWNGDEPALIALREVAASAPIERQAVVWAVWMSARAGDTATTDRFQRIAQFGDESGAAASLTQGVAGPGESSLRGPRSNLGLYSQALYRRPLPPSLLAVGLPQLVHLDVPRSTPDRPSR